MTRLNVTGEGLDLLPPPDIIKTVDFEALCDEIKADYLSRYPDAEIDLESDPVVKLIETVAYRTMLNEQRVNDGARAVLTGTASESELNYLGARFKVTRQAIDEGAPNAIPPIPPTLEPIERFRERVQLALDGRSTAGPEGAYIFHVLNASALIKDVAIDAPEFAWAELAPELLAQLPPDVLVLQCTHDAGLTDPMPGDVAVTALSTQGNGETITETDNAITQALNDDVVPLSDRPRLRDAEIINYHVVAELDINPGPDAETILQVAITAVTDYVAQQHRLGVDVSLSGIYAALHQPGVIDVNLSSPAANISITAWQAAWCTNINITRRAG